jgi:asparagine synthase (glutamine-hydrolysing)
MCGIAGIIRHTRDQQDEEIIKTMTESLAHRGPDDQGIYKYNGVTLGHRRLSIIDPKGGKQPMSNEDKSIWIVFNGAIYNYLELRQELIAQGHCFDSYSDTEVIIHLYEQYGVNGLQRLNGMFAFVILDQRCNKIFAARDRFGIKPFYYCIINNSIFFASEQKAFIASGILKAEVNNDSLQDYLTFQFTLENKTLFKNIYKLEQGNYFIIDLKEKNLSIKTNIWWDLNFIEDIHHTEDYFKDKLISLISESIKMRMRADVPVGSYLSGGLDSSTISIIASGTISGTNYNTFTGKFDEGIEYDESPYANIIAEQIKSNHHELSINEKDFLNNIEKIIYSIDEPCAGPGVLPQYCVAKMASEFVKVVLGGQGGDEVFIGYVRYLIAYFEEVIRGSIFETNDKIRHSVSLESIIPNLPLLQQYIPMIRTFWGDGLFNNNEYRYFKLIDRSETIKCQYEKDIFNSSTYSPFESYKKIFLHHKDTSYINKMTYFDIKSSLPALLQIDDRTGMAFGLESRLPFLDYRIVELIATVPPGIKFKGGRLKSIFRETIRNILPIKILNRKDKMGFPVPINNWFKNKLRDYIYDILLSKQALNRGFYKYKFIEDILTNKSPYNRIIWGYLCLELWFKTFIDNNNYIKN